MTEYTTDDPIDALGRYLTHLADAAVDAVVAEHGDAYKSIILLYPVNGQTQRYFYRWWTAICTEIATAYYMRANAPEIALIAYWYGFATDHDTLAGLFPHLPIEHADGRHIGMDALMRLLNTRIAQIPQGGALPAAFQDLFLDTAIDGIVYHGVALLVQEEADNILHNSWLAGGTERAAKITDDDVEMIWQASKARLLALPEAMHYRTTILDH